LILSARGKSPRLVWLVPAIAAVWANVHGSFFLVPALVLLAWVQDRSRGGPGRHRLLVVVAISAAATLVNPFGLGVWKYSAGLIADPLLPRFVSEWQPPSLRDPAGAAFFLSVALVVLVLARRRAPVEWSSLMWLGSFLFLGLAATRGIVWWVLVAPVVLSGLFPEGNESRSPVPETQDRSPAVNLAIAGIALAVMVSLLPWWRDTPSVSSGPLLGGIPVGITTYLQRSTPPSTRLFAPDGWASWFELSVPNRPVFVDSRIELFPADIWMQYQRVFFAQEGWERVLDSWKVDVLVVDAHADSPLARSVARSSGWRVVYRDSDGLVAERAV
jgi:hypothetical protein